jgi:GH15 family glucan-1,4-alpha-glucosidase
MKKENRYLPIADYGLIGNLHTTALVSKSGSLDYLTFPRYDSPTLFGSILDRDRGGYFAIESKENDLSNKQIYMPDTAVLITKYLSGQGIAEVTDFMLPVVHATRFILIRTLRNIKGRQDFRAVIKPGFDYGTGEFTTHKKDNYLVISNKRSPEVNLRLYSNVELDREYDQLSADITMKGKEEVHFILAEVSGEKDQFEIGDIHHFSKDRLDRTIRFWQDWISKSSYRGRWQDMVTRSAITLKLLTSYHYGSTVASATFGLPEKIGGTYNWDYRYSWIRDSSFMMYTFLQLGYFEEAQKFIQWIEQRTHEITDPGELKLMYRIDGNVDLNEEELSGLEGYMGSKPVRKGNDAYKQFQLDIYGELIDTIFIYNKNAEPLSYAFWLGLTKFIDYVAENWKEKDSGIWETRKEKREYLISKVMSWVALDRGILIAEDRSFPAPLEKWRAVRNEIYTDVFHNYWNPRKKAFVQYRGAGTLDASALLIPLVRMFSPKEPRWMATLHALEHDLRTESLIYRYSQDVTGENEIPDTEGTFSMCSFWYAECLAKMGDLEKAVFHFEKMLGYANHLGLYSEQMSMKGEMLGNFPQAFTHLALISAAIKLRLLTEQGSLLKQQDIRQLRLGTNLLSN